MRSPRIVERRSTVKADMMITWSFSRTWTDVSAGGPLPIGAPSHLKLAVLGYDGVDAQGAHACLFEI